MSARGNVVCCRELHQRQADQAALDPEGPLDKRRDQIPSRGSWPQGPAGIANVTSALGPSALQCPVSGGACKAATSVATCTQGSSVIGGGYRSTMADNIIEVATRSSATTYTVEAVNHGSLNGAIIAEARGQLRCRDPYAVALMQRPPRAELRCR